MAGAQHGRAWCVGVAAHGVAVHLLNRDPALGCAGHYRASTRPTIGARTAQPSGGQRCGTRRRSDALRSLHKKARRDGWLTGASLGDGEHKDMDCPGATNCRGRLHKRLGWPAAWPRACVMVRGHSRACIRAASPCPLGAAVWYTEVQHEAGRRRTRRSLHNNSRLDGRFPHEILARRRQRTKA
jgi:hypothetical protein